MNPLKKVLFLSLSLSLLAMLALLLPTRKVDAQTSRINPIVAAPTVSIPVTVSNTPLPIQGSTTVSGNVNAAQAGAWNVGITGNSLNTPLFVRDVSRDASHLINDGQHFIVQPNPNIALELPLPADAVLTDVTLTLLTPSQPLIFVDAGGGNNNKIYAWQRVGSANSTGAPSNDGHFSMHLESGIQNTNGGLRVGIYCPGYDGNGCDGVLMWSGYQP